MRKSLDLKEEKLTEKAFSKYLVISVLGILLCIVALCSITYAWFVNETTSASNTLLAGSFDLTVTVSKDGDEFPVVADANKDGVWVCDLTEEGIYTVNLKIKEDSTVKGHCIVKVGDGDAMHTDVIVYPDTTDFTFTVKVSENTKVTFEPRWGMVVEPDIKNGDLIDDVTEQQDGEEPNGVS